jgi:hypothetical protein
MLILRARHLMLLMGSKLDEQILQVHWGSCLIMVIIFLHHVFILLFFVVYACMWLMTIFSTTLQGVMHLLVQYVSFSFLDIVFKPLKENKESYLWELLFSLKHLLLGAHPCVEEVLSGGGWYLQLHFMVQPGSSKLLCSINILSF